MFAVWTGGLGIWGGVALAAPVGVWRLRKWGLRRPFANAIAPALLVAQAVGRIGNYFNQELFGKPTGLPWGLEVPLAYRPAGYPRSTATFQPSFLYELIWDLALAAFLVWLGITRGSSHGACSRCTWPATPDTGSSRRPSGSTPRSTSSGCG